MRNNIVNISIAILLFCLSLPAGAQGKSNKKPSDGAKQLSGISIVGNKEAPKSLFIVPWKSSDIGAETSLSSQLLNEMLTPLDKDVFERELRFYYAARKKD